MVSIIPISGSKFGFLLRLYIRANYRCWWYGGSGQLAGDPLKNMQAFKSHSQSDCICTWNFCLAGGFFTEMCTLITLAF